MKRASIDIGSNSVLLLACDFDFEIKSELLNLSHITSLGKDLDKTGIFNSDSMKATYDALIDYKNQLANIGIHPTDVVATATEAARVAKNSSDFFKKIKQEIGFEIKIISGEQEAYYTALGVASGLKTNNDSCVIMDIGGASTEFILLNLKDQKIVSSISLPVGSVRATDWKNENIFNEKMNQLLATNLAEYKTDNLICVAGSMTSLASMYLGKKVFNDKEIDGLKINFNEFRKFSAELQRVSHSELLLNFPFLGKRAAMVSGGAKVAELFGEKLEIQSMQISTRGLRYGVLIKGDLK